MQANRWRRLYQHDVVSTLCLKEASTRLTDLKQPVLHLEDKCIQKNRINAPELQRLLEEWQAMRRAEEDTPSP